MNFNKFQKISISFFAMAFLLSTFYFLLSVSNVFAQSTAVFNPQYPWENVKTPEGLVGKFYEISLGVVGALAFGILIYGAILYSVSGAVSTQAEAREWISAALWGLVLLLAAYLILFNINPGLVGKGAAVSPAPPSVPPQFPTPPSPTIGGWPPNSSSFGAYSDYQARMLLSAAEISVNKSNCASVGQTNCTSLEGIPQTTVEALKRMAKEAEEKNNVSSMIITGGTEYWLHSTHGPGRPVVDIRYDTALMSTIDSWHKAGQIPFYQCEKNGTKVSCGGSTIPDHFHIRFTR